MTQNLPRPDLSRFLPLAPEIVVLCCLGAAKRAGSADALKKKLGEFVPPAFVDQALAALASAGQANVGKAIVLTDKGKAAAQAALGADAGASWETIWKRRLPAIALGLAPDEREVRLRYAKVEALRSSAISIAFAVPATNIASKTAVCGELVWRTLRAALPDLVGRGPFPALEKIGPVESVLLAGLAQAPHSRRDPVAALSAAAVGLSDISPDGLRKRLIVLGVQRATEQSDAESATKTPDGFAGRVKSVAASLTTPPFQGRVAIAQVYDAYGRDFPDAGSLDAFKARMVEAARARELDLARLDMPERMDQELRRRSEARWDSDEVHFVVTERK